MASGRTLWRSGNYGFCIPQGRSIVEAQLCYYIHYGCLGRSGVRSATLMAGSSDPADLEEGGGGADTRASICIWQSGPDTCAGLTRRVAARHDVAISRACHDSASYATVIGCSVSPWLQVLIKTPVRRTISA